MPLNLFGKKKPPESRLCVLHIDDSQWIRIPVSVLLRRHFGMRVLEAGGGLEGLQQAQAELPDLILLDVMMPQMDGFDTLIKLKENPRTKNIPVLMVTSRDVMREVNMALRLGAVGYLTKPIEEDRLLAKVQETLQAAGKLLEPAKRLPPPIDPALDVVHASEDKKTEAERNCPFCQKPLQFIDQYAAWYCVPCRKYA